MNVVIRKGEEKDLVHVLALIKELALYEKAPHEVTMTLEQLHEDGFGSRPLYEFIVATVNEQVVGLSFYYFRYSTWKGKFLYLEDFVVKDAFRGMGIGKLLFETTMKIALDSKCVGMKWQVLDWNEPAIRFYQKYGAVLDPEWLNGTLMSHEMALQLSVADT